MDHETLVWSVYGALKAKILPFPDENKARTQVVRLKDALDGKAPLPESPNSY